MTAGADWYGDHTLLVTTYDRPFLLRRLLEFVCARGPVGTILVADASCEPVKIVNARLIARLRAETGARIEHRLFVHDLSVIALHVAGVDAVDTPLMTFISDDDFIVPEAVRQSVAFLRDHPDYAACAGRYGFATASDRDVVVTLGLNAPVDHPDPVSRFTALFADYWSVEFGTWRTEVKRACCAAFAVFDIDEALGEPLHGLCATLLGKIHVVDRLSTVRTNHAGNNAKRNLDRRLLFARPQFRDAFSRVVALVGDILCSAGQPVPPQLAPRLMRSLLRHVAGNRGYFRDSIGFAIARGRWPEITPRDADRILGAMRTAFDAAFLGADAPAFRAAHETARKAIVERPGIRDDRLVTLVHDRLVLHALSSDSADMLDGAEVSSPDVERMFDAHAETFLDDRFQRRYRAFRARIAEGLSDVRREAPALVDALFIVMIAEDLGVHARGPGDLLAHIMRRLPVGLGDDEETDALTQLCVALQGEADGEAASAPRLLHEHPAAPTDVLDNAVDVASARQANGVTLLPFSLPPMAAAHDDVWVHLRLHLIRGCVQLCLVRDGRMEWIATAWPARAAKDYYLPILGDAPEWVALRDIGAGSDPAHMQVEAIDLACSRPEALRHTA